MQSDVAGRGIRLLTACCLLVALVAGCAERDEDGLAVDTLAVDTTAAADTTAAVGTESIYDVLQNDQRFSSFVAAVDSAQLDQTLSGPGPFTVFAPTNDAIAASGVDLQGLMSGEREDELRDLLLGHISNGEKTAASLSGTIRTLAGGDVQVTGSGDSLRVGDARLAEANIAASNGIVHAVDAVLTPSMDEESL